MDRIKVIYKDRSMIIAVKPVGSVSDGDDGTVADLLREQLGYAYVEPMHRLDRVCGGLMLFSCNKNTAGRFSALVANGEYKKEYLAVLDGAVSDTEGTLEDILFHDRKSGKTFVIDRERSGAKRASLDYSVVDTAETSKGVKTLVSVRLHTGRTHQIRSQFSSRKLPICGDGKYGSRDNGCGCALWSFASGLVHPITGKELHFSELPPIENYPWSLFADKLHELKSQNTEDNKGE